MHCGLLQLTPPSTVSVGEHVRFVPVQSAVPEKTHVVSNTGASKVGMAVGLPVGCVVGLAVGWPVGFVVGLPVGITVGLAVGWPVGFVVGLFVGFTVGLALGFAVGIAVGLDMVGKTVGTELDGPIVGVAVGAAVGFKVVGVTVGTAVVGAKLPLARTALTRGIGLLQSWRTNRLPLQVRLIMPAAAARLAASCSHEPDWRWQFVKTETLGRGTEQQEVELASQQEVPLLGARLPAASRH